MPTATVLAMRITGALLAESAQVEHGRLGLAGGGLHHVVVEPGQDVAVTIVVLVAARDEELERGLAVDVELLTDTDYMPPVPSRISLPAPARAGVLHYLLDAPQPGRYVFVVGGQITLPLLVSRP